MRALALALLVLLGAIAGAEAFRPRGSGSQTTTPPPTATDLVSIGDSITAFTPPTGYPYLISVDKSLTLTNRAIGTYQTCWMNLDEVFPNEDPQITGAPIYTFMGGTNDEVIYGADPGSPGPVVTGHEGLYVNCLWAAASWLATPSAAKVIPSTCSKTGTWTVTTSSFRPNQAISNDGLGDTITCPVNVVNGVIYVWFRRGYDFFYSIDGGSDIAGSIPYSLTGDQSVNVLRVTGLSNGAHTIRIKNNYGGGGIIMGPVGTGTTSNCCRVMMSNIIREQNDNNAARNLNYSNLATAAATTMAGDGLQIVAVDARSYVNTTTDMADTLHPNSTGLRHIADAFEAVWGSGPPPPT